MLFVKGFIKGCIYPEDIGLKNLRCGVVPEVRILANRHTKFDFLKAHIPSRMITQLALT